MSSSDLTSSEKTSSRELGVDEELESLDESLDAILSEGKAASPIVGGGATGAAVSVLVAPVAEAKSGHSAAPVGPITRLEDDEETPLPVIVDELPSYWDEDDAVSVDAGTGPKSLETRDVERAAGDAATPRPEVNGDGPGESGPSALEPEARMAATTPSRLADRNSEPSEAEEATPFTPSPPSDEEFLAQVVLPPSATPMPLAGLGLGEDDRTVISPMPPMPEPAPLPPPRLTRSETTAAMTPSSVETTSPVVLRPGEGMGDRLRKVATSRVQASVATLAAVVIGASALGGVVVGLANHSPRSQTAPTIALPAAPPKAAAANTSAPPLPPAAAELPQSPTAEKSAAGEDRPVPQRPASHTKGRAAAGSETHVALAAPSVKPAAPARTPAPSAAAKPKKPAAHASSGWVDPFGQ